MKGEITIAMIEECYHQATRIRRDITSKSGAIKIVVAKTGISEGSAQRTIDSILKMFDGRLYASIINHDGMIVVLDNIYNDYGEDALKRALRATIQHINYLENEHNANKSNMKALVNEYIDKYSLNMDKMS